MRTKTYVDNINVDGMFYAVKSTFSKESESFIREVIDNNSEEDPIIGTIGIEIFKTMVVETSSTLSDGTEIDIEDFRADYSSMIGNLSTNIIYYNDSDDDEQEFIAVITNIAVIGNHRHRGFGSILLNKLDSIIFDNLYENSKALESGINSIIANVVDASDEICDFFDNCGYDIEGISPDYTIYKLLDWRNKPVRTSIKDKDKVIEEYKYVFVSQPMSGLTLDQIVADRDRAYLNICNGSYLGDIDPERIKVIDNLQTDRPEGTKPLEYIAEDIRLLADADIMYFIKGWETHRGCVTEFFVGREYGVQMYFEE